MANALIYCKSGGGKTVNSTLVAAPKRGKNLLICTDNSSIVLQNFDRPNLEIQNVGSVKEFMEAYHAGEESKKYDNIILDNISDLVDMWLLELDTSGKFKDFRQAYQLVYQGLKKLARDSSEMESNTIFTAWCDIVDYPLPSGEVIKRLQPKLPSKVLDNFCGLINVVGYVNAQEGKDGKKYWYYVTEEIPSLYTKDQIGCRKACRPEDVFTRTNQTK